MKCPKCQFGNPDTQRFCGECGTQITPAKESSVSPTKTLVTPVKELTRGTTFAERYEFIEELGTGGMGSVYRVFDKKIEEEVAIKLLKPEIASDKKTIDRFRNELKLARKISHRNVCRMYELMEEEGTHYITMEYVSGEDLKSFIKRSGQLTVGKSLSMAKQICDGLSEAHRLGVVHRDLKPQNIMIDKEGNARIMDFGIARSLKTKGITGTGVMIGTPEYMSPEQVEGKEVDTRSDIYSLGIILYEMLTGTIPFEGETPFSIALKHKSEVPRHPKEINPQIPDDLSGVILTCMEKNREKRYQKAEELLSELTNIEKGIPATERIVPKGKPLTAREITVTFRLKKFLIPATVVVVLIIAAVVIWQLLPKKEVVPSEPRKPSIAVLPFEDLSPQKDQEYFCDGMTDEIIADLSQVRGLSRVISRTSVMKFKGTQTAIKTIGQELDVQYILEGSVRKAGNNIRITAKLIDARNDAQLWAEKYTGTLEDIFEIQEKVSHSIVGALKLELSPEEMRKITELSIKDVRAYQYYLRARQEMTRLTEDSLDRALQLLQNGLEILGENAMIYTGLGKVYLEYYDYGIRKGEVYLQKAEEYAKKALALESDNVLALSLLGSVERQKGNMTESLRYYKLAFSIDPNIPENLRRLSYYYTFFAGKLSTAALLVKKLSEIDPVTPRNQHNVGAVHWMEGRFDMALELERKSYQMDPDDPLALWYYAQLLAWNNLFDEAYEFIDKLARDLPQHSLSWTSLFFKYSLQGERDKALQLVTEDRKSYAWKDYHLPWTMAECYALLDEKEEALDWLEHAISKGWINYPLFSKLDPFLKNIRGEVRFKKLMEKVKYEWQHVEDLEWPTK